MGELKPQAAALRTDAPYYTDAELDALYERDPVAAMRLSRRQLELQREFERARSVDPQAAAPTTEALNVLLDQARAILRRDGGDLQLVSIEGDVVTVRLSGSCAGCPRSALDLKHVVERLVRERFPQIASVRRVL